MRNRLHIVFLLFAVSCAGICRAQESEHYFALWSEGSASFLLKQSPHPAQQIGAGGGLGLGYEFNYYRFIMQLGVQSYAAQERLNSPGDTYTTVYLQTPLLLGGEFNHLYFLTGVKFNLSVFTTAPQPPTPLDQIHYDDLIHYDVLASAEIGLNWTLQQFRYTKPKIRLALYADYGLLDSRPQAGLKLTFLFGGKAHENHVCRRCPDYAPFR